MITCPYCHAELPILIDDLDVDFCEHTLYVSLLMSDTYEEPDSRHIKDQWVTWSHPALRSPKVTEHIGEWACRGAGVNPKLSPLVAHAWVQVWGHPDRDPDSSDPGALLPGNTLGIAILYGPIPEAVTEAIQTAAKANSRPVSKVRSRRAHVRQHKA
jgi:hypothetical protein